MFIQCSEWWEKGIRRKGTMDCYSGPTDENKLIFIEASVLSESAEDNINPVLKQTTILLAELQIVYSDVYFWCFTLELFRLFLARSNVCLVILMIFRISDLPLPLFLYAKCVWSVWVFCSFYSVLINNISRLGFIIH